jgi:hypothetical protein
MTLNSRLNELEQAAASDAAEAERPFCKGITLRGPDHRTVRATLRELGYLNEDLEATGKLICWWVEGRTLVTPAHGFDSWEWAWHVRFFHHVQRQLRKESGDPRRLIGCEKVTDALDAAFDRFDAWRGRGCPHDPLPPELEADPVFHLVVELCWHGLKREEAAT